MNTTRESGPGEATAIPEELLADVRTVRDAFRDYGNGSMSEDDFAGMRQMRGIYIQRQPGVYMVRVKVPLGLLTPHQLRCIAAVSRDLGNGSAHLTTRQTVQIYFIAPADVPEAVARLAEAGLTTRESSGPTVRNVTVCPMAGICSHQNADVTRYARAVATHFQGNPLVQKLPRKIKIAFSGCERDCSLSRIHDIGFVALPGSGEDTDRFRMAAAGGLGASPQIAPIFEESLSGSEVLPTTESLIRAFEKHGDRKSRAKARMKFLVRRIGMECLREMAEEERKSVPVSAGIGAGTPVPAPAPPLSPVDEPLPGFEGWRRRTVMAQRQEGFFAARVFVSGGYLSVEQMETLADAAERFGHGEIRATVTQGILLPWIEEANLPGVHRALTGCDLAEPYAGSAADSVACPGAATCRFAIVRGKDAAQEVSTVLKPLVDGGEMMGVSVRVSGCPNSCGQHHLGTIGLHGAASTIDGKRVPCYQVYVGGQGAGGARLGRSLARIPARRLSALVERFVALWRENRLADEGFADFLLRVENDWLKERIADLTEMVVRPGEEESLFIDLGATEPFRVGAEAKSA